MAGGLLVQALVYLVYGLRQDGTRSPTYLSLLYFRAFSVF